MPRNLLYMAVTPDEFELPIFVGTSTEVAELADISLSTLYGMVSKGRSGKVSGRKFVKVEM